MKNEEQNWKPIATAPDDGTRFIGRIKHYKAGTCTKYQRLITWWGKASHVPLYGWCHGYVENVDLWQPTHWRLK